MKPDKAVGPSSFFDFGALFVSVHVTSWLT